MGTSHRPQGEQHQRQRQQQQQRSRKITTFDQFVKFITDACEFWFFVFLLTCVYYLAMKRIPAVCLFWSLPRYLSKVPRCLPSVPSIHSLYMYLGLLYRRCGDRENPVLPCTPFFLCLFITDKNQYPSSTSNIELTEEKKLLN